MENEEFDFHKIATFADACMRLGISAVHLPVESLGDTEAFLQASAFYKLMIIQKAINNGKWCNENGYSYSPYWMFYTKEKIAYLSEEEKQILGIKHIISCVVAPDTGVSGVRCAGVCTRSGLIFTDCGFPILFNSRKAAEYAAKQFEYLFFQYYGIKVKA